MIVIRALQLILDHYQSSIFLSYYVNTKRANFSFLFHKLEVEIESLSKLIEVFPQPRCEVLVLELPNTSNRDPFQTTNSLFVPHVDLQRFSLSEPRVR